MSCAPFCQLLARHVRFQCDLLALRRQTTELTQVAAEGDWEARVSRRQRLVDRLRVRDGPKLTAESVLLLARTDRHPLAGALEQFQQRQLTLMGKLATEEHAARRAFGRELARLERWLLTAQEARAARETYAVQRHDCPRVDRRG